MIDEILAILQLFKVEVPLSHDQAFVGSGTSLFCEVIDGIALLRLLKHMIKKLFSQPRSQGLSGVGEKETLVGAGHVSPRIWKISN